MGFLEKLRGVPSLDTLLKEVPEHFQRHLGPLSESVFHELVSDQIHLDVHMVGPSDRFPYKALFTTGMATRATKGGGPIQLSELMIIVPPTYPTDFTSEEHFWPIKHMKTIARMPHQMGFNMRPFLSVPISDPPEPAPGSKFAGFMAVPPVFAPPAFQTIQLKSGIRIPLFVLMPLTMMEMDWKANSATADAFWQLALSNGRNPLELCVIDENRPSVI